ncbi:ATPase, T2SS/T4P/T4SS family [bacterium]|nr:ATPase, T2SS/T4P/T4SS family [bacterium]
MRHKTLGALLLEEKLLDQQTLDQALELQKKNKRKLGQNLISMGVVSEETILNLLAKQLNIPFIDLLYYDLDPALMILLPEIHARQYGAVILSKNGHIQVGMIDPVDINAVDAISKILKYPVTTALVSESVLLSILDRVYRRTSEISNFAKELSSEIGDELITSSDRLFDEHEEMDEHRAPVVKLLNALFHDAVQAGASDIHIEPGEKTLGIRFRVDGVLTEYIFNEKRISSALIQRLKLRANLDISEHRIPLDGSFSFEIKGQSYDVRLSTLPTVNGESLVMRLLKQSATMTDLSQMGIDKDLVKRIEAIYSKPFGMLLVTGPTGSGKSTTLYSILSRLNTPECKIITAEDPVEYRLNRINQVQINSKIDLSFARVLRAILRQDPDVIMVGEIRDAETALIAMRAAVTGHFVMATMHTNDAVGSALRLIDMGAEGFMVAAAVKAIIGQRLVRNICKACIKDHEPDLLERRWLESLKVDPATIRCKEGEGCSHCGLRGYVGRTGIYELLELNSDMVTALRLNDSSLFAQAALACESYQPLSQSVLELIKKGVTSISEAIRVVGQLEEEFQKRVIVKHEEP